MKDTKNLDRVLTLRSWAHGREHQRHHRIDRIGLCGKEIRHEAKAEIKAKKPLFSTELTSELSSTTYLKKIRPELARKIAREAKRANR